MRRHPNLSWSLVTATACLMIILPCMACSQQPGQEAIAQNDVKTLARALEQYLVEYAVTPKGSHAKIIRSLGGDNPRRVIFLEVGPKSLNAAGEFVDPWGMALHIDLSDAAKLRVYSSGRNKLDEHGAKGTDDIVSWPQP